MLPVKFCILLCYLSVLCISDTSATRTKDRIYASIQGTAACFRRMNGTHQFGCASNRKGNVGVLELIASSDDLEWLVDKAPVPPYMIVLHMDMFTKPVLVALKDSKKVSGVVLLKNDNSSSSLSHFSHEDSCPNRYSGFSSFESQQCSDDKPWNRDGTALMLVDWGFPIFYAHNQTSINKILDCQKKYNSDRVDQDLRSLCAMEMNAFMFAAKDSETCIRRTNMINNLNPVRYCDPLADRNIWATIFPRSKSEPEAQRSMIVLSARMDSTSMFDGDVPGAGSTVAGLVTALAAVNMLASLREQMEPLRAGRNIMLALLNGEAYDYIGSSRMVYDMQAGMFPSKSTNLQPLNLTSLRLFVELNQVTNLNKSTTGDNTATLFFHSTPQVNQVKPAEEVTRFISLMKAQSDKVKINMETSQGPLLPPASLQIFSKADTNLPGVVITDHDDHFQNRFYHSILDNTNLLDFKYLNGSGEAPVGSIQHHLAGLSTALAKTVYEMTTDQPYNGQLKVDSLLIDELLQCLLVSMNCRTFKSVTESYERPPSYPPSMYVGVGSGPNLLTRYIGLTLALFTGTKLKNVSRSECKSNDTDLTYQYLWMRGAPEALENSSVCIQTTMNYSVASSPAFMINGYNWSSGQYSTWTESIWRDFSVRIFLKPSQRHETFVFSFGCIVMLLSFPIIWFITSRSDILFNSNTLNGGC